METAARYFATIESLMVENSRLTKELQDAVHGKLPANIISQEMAEQCYHKIAHILGPIAKGNLLDEVTVLCDEFIKIANEYMVINAKLGKHTKENAALEKAVKGEDIDENYEATQLVSNVIRLRTVLEIIKTRLDRLVTCNSNITELAELRKDVAGFLSGEKNE